MKIEQTPHPFQPVTLTLETPEEVSMLWQSIREYSARGPVEIAFCKTFDKWFIENYKP